MKLYVASRRSSLTRFLKIAAVASLVGLILSAVALLSPTMVGAQKPAADGDSDGPCDLEAQVITTPLKTTGFFLPGATIAIETKAPIISMNIPLKTNPRFCRVSTAPVPIGKWSWQILERPALSTSQLVVGVTGLNVSLRLDQPGVYKIGFTACPLGCRFKLPDQTMFPVDPARREIVVRVLAILPPGQLPALPRSARLSTSKTPVESHCAFDEDITSATWLTVKPWSGPSDYKLLEGAVTESVVTSVDNDLNHYSQDWNIQVTPDPSHRELINANSSGQDGIEVEWERDYLPEIFRPTVGDRVSTIGYWIYDCDHSKRSEIHPPVLLAVHRPRTIELPSSAGVGSNAFVPGIITDIWVNREAGGGTDDCASTGLWQQKDPSKPPVDSHGRPIFRCLPDSEGFSSNPINRVFEFNIYLPTSPHALMARFGKTAPPVPLFKVTSNPGGSAGPEPVVTLDESEDVPYLKVRIDLRSYTKQTYSRRIVAAWAYAAPDNWGARRWNVRVNSMNITDDTDPNPLGFSDNGDWRFWVNTNNGSSEWAKLFDCGGCAHGNETFDGRPWVTNSASPDRDLGADIVLLPNQPIMLNTTGFDEDFTFEDKISPLSLRLPQVAGSNSVTADENSGKYVLHYQVLPGAAVGRSQLTAAALGRYNAYVLTNNDLRGRTAEALAILNASFNGGGSLSTAPTATDDTAERDSSSGRIDAPRLLAIIQKIERTNPGQLDAFFRDVDRFIQRAKKAHREDKVSQFLRALKPAVPTALWRARGFEGQLTLVTKAE
jgi:hypothetical protein